MSNTLEVRNTSFLLFVHHNPSIIFSVFVTIVLLREFETGDVEAHPNTGLGRSSIDAISVRSIDTALDLSRGNRCPNVLQAFLLEFVRHWAGLSGLSMNLAELRTSQEMVRPMAMLGRSPSSILRRFKVVTSHAAVLLLHST